MFDPQHAEIDTELEAGILDPKAELEWNIIAGR